jgi:hypothetical protein
MSMQDFELDHIGVIAEDFAPFQELARRLGASVRGPDQLPELELEFLYIDLGRGVELEVIRPLSENAAAAAEIRAGRGGVHHFGFRVAETGAALGQLAEAGFEPLDPEPRPGIYDSRIGFAFVGPALVEVIQHADPR